MSRRGLDNHSRVVYTSETCTFPLSSCLLGSAREGSSPRPQRIGPVSCAAAIVCEFDGVASFLACRARMLGLYRLSGSKYGD
jgi:hypothetical protein